MLLGGIQSDQWVNGAFFNTVSDSVPPKAQNLPSDVFLVQTTHNAIQWRSYGN